MLNKEIVVSILKETGKIEKDEEFYDDSEEFLSKLNEDTVVFLSSPISETLDKASLLIGDLYKGKYSLSLPKGSEYFTVDNNIVFKLARGKKEDKNPVAEVLRPDEQGERISAIQHVISGGDRPLDTPLDRTLPLLKKLAETGDKDVSSDLVSYVPEYRQTEPGGPRYLTLRPADPIFTDYLMMPNVAKRVKRLTKHGPESKTLHTAEDFIPLYHMSDLPKPLKTVLDEGESNLVQRLYVPTDSRSIDSAFTKYVAHEDTPFKHEDPMDMLAYSLGVSHRLHERKDGLKDVKEHIQSAMDSIEELMRERSHLTENEIQDNLKYLKTDEFAERVQDKIKRLQHIRPTKKVSDKKGKLDKISIQIPNLYFRGNISVTPVPGKDPSVLSTQNHTFIRNNPKRSKSLDMESEESNRHVSGLYKLFAPHEIYGISKRGHEHLSDEIEHKMSFTQNLTSSLMDKYEQTTDPAQKQEIKDKLERIKLNHDNLLYMYMSLHLGMRPGYGEESSKSKKASKASKASKPAKGLATLENSHIDTSEDTPTIVFSGKGSSEEGSVGNAVPLEGKLKDLVFSQLKTNKRLKDLLGSKDDRFFSIVPDNKLLNIMSPTSDLPFNLHTISRKLGLLDHKGQPIVIPYTFRKFNAIRRTTDMAHGLGVRAARTALLDKIPEITDEEKSKMIDLGHKDFITQVYPKLKQFITNRDSVNMLYKQLHKQFDPDKTPLPRFANLILQHAVESPSYQNYVPKELWKRAYITGVKQLLLSLKKGKQK